MKCLGMPESKVTSQAGLYGFYGAREGDAHQKHVRSCMEQRGDHLKHLNEGNGLNNLHATVGGVIEMPLCHGPGPDHNVVPRHVVEQLQRLDDG
ncbi:hypothetical protein PI125_g9933 [Phytophthora idaei]|nr:hypothetical protein PI125_g9933 [Phytophthora idaei]